MRLNALCVTDDAQLQRVSPAPSALAWLLCRYYLALMFRRFRALGCVPGPHCACPKPTAPARASRKNTGMLKVFTRRIRSAESAPCLRAVAALTAPTPTAQLSPAASSPSVVVCAQSARRLTRDAVEVAERDREFGREHYRNRTKFIRKKKQPTRDSNLYSKTRFSSIPLKQKNGTSRRKNIRHVAVYLLNSSIPNCMVS